jgi:transcriptional regulator with XRE-family HTH domain
MKIGEKLRKVRQLRDLSQDCLGREIGLDQNAISRFENDKIAPDLFQLHKIATALQIKTVDLLLFDEEKLLNCLTSHQEKDCDSCIWKLAMMNDSKEILDILNFEKSTA